MGWGESDRTWSVVAVEGIVVNRSLEWRLYLGGGTVHDTLTLFCLVSLPN